MAFGKSYQIYTRPIIKQYLQSLQVGVWAINGCDILPRDLWQTYYGAFGLFMGAVINANIFGELFIIISGIDPDGRRFQAKITRSNTVMIDLKIPFDMQ